MRSTTYSRFCKKLLSKLFKKFRIEDKIKDHALEKADIKMPYNEYYSMAYMNIFISSVVAFIISFILYFMFLSALSTTLLLLLPASIPLFVALYYLSLPKSRMKKRAKEIDRLLPYVANFISTMSSAGISPAEIFKTLSTIDLYTEIQKEAQKITKEIYLMGVDTVTALKHAIEVSPSRKFKDFLQGIIGVIQSGSDLNAYFKTVVDRYMMDDLAYRKKNLESLAVIAETFVVTVIAFPLFLVIILSVMSFTSSGGGMNTFFFLFLFSLLILPLAYLGYFVIMKSTAVET
ncbi:MAG: type II secretion system F family protein [Thermoplasmata archaeon]|nr:type II secretion system F family protein [Thermoplasmata archaeon]